MREFSKVLHHGSPRKHGATKPQPKPFTTEDAEVAEEAQRKTTKKERCHPEGRQERALSSARE
jgi:hypothetical protein